MNSGTALHGFPARDGGEAMYNIASEDTYEDGQVIFKEGSSGDWVYVVLSGSVEISKMLGDQKMVIEVLAEGEIFGELSFLGGIKRSATATAVGPTTLGVVDREYLDQQFNNLSSDFRTVLSALVKRFKKLSDTAVAASS
jgi:CRP-like cAMP-binding protein